MLGVISWLDVLETTARLRLDMFAHLLPLSTEKALAVHSAAMVSDSRERLATTETSTTMMAAALIARGLRPDLPAKTLTPYQQHAKASVMTESL